jgi:hypothetical protein
MKNEFSINLASSLSVIKYYNKNIRKIEPNYFTDYLKSYNLGKKTFNNIFDENDDVRNYRLSMRKKHIF